MIGHETAIINQFSTSRAEVVAASRFFNNEAVDLEALIEATRAASAAGTAMQAEIRQGRSPCAAALSD